jgi:hypothetical protein
MRRASSKLAMVAVLALGTLGASAEQVIDRIVAKVGDSDIILLSDIKDLERYQMFADGKTESDEEVLNRLIDQWMVRNEAKAALFPQPSDEDVKRSLERLKRTFSTPEEFEERQKRAGLTDDDLNRILRAQLYLTNYLDSRFRASIQVSDEDIEKFYKTRIVPRAESRGQPPPTLDAARGFIQEALVQRAINEQSERWLKESRARVHVENLLNESIK